MFNSLEHQLIVNDIYGVMSLGAVVGTPKLVLPVRFKFSLAEFARNVAVRREGTDDRDDETIDDKNKPRYANTKRASRMK